MTRRQAKNLKMDIVACVGWLPRAGRPCFCAVIGRRDRRPRQRLKIRVKPATHVLEER